LIRIAAVGDIHYGIGERGPLTPHLRDLRDSADLLLLAGDLTRHGDPAEAGVLAEDLATLPMPKVAVLGNHDYHQDREHEVMRVIRDAGVCVLEGDSAVLRLDGMHVGIAGAKGFGGGFAGACVTEFGERETKAFAHHSAVAAEDLAAALEEVRTVEVGVRIALLHYSPVEQTLVGEPPQLWPFLGNYLLAEAVDRVGADLVLHGHAHSGSPEGATPKGVPVLNVAHPVIKKPYELIQLGA
jgi:Icc-related predicted phosphoesterase